MKTQLDQKQIPTSLSRIYCPSQINKSYSYNIYNAIEHETSFYEQLTSFRRNPLIIKSILESRKQYYNSSNMLFSPNHPNKSLKTSEGTKAVNLLLGEILNQRQLKTFNYNEQLSKYASWIAQQYNKCPSDQQDFMKRLSVNVRQEMSKSGKFSPNVTVKCIIGISFLDKYQPLISILLDDGDPQRQKQKLMLSNSFTSCGIGFQILAEKNLILGVYLLVAQD